MGSKIIEIFNKIAYNVLSALYQPFWAAVLLAFLATILLEICLQHGGEHLEVLQIFAGHSY